MGMRLIGGLTVRISRTRSAAEQIRSTQMLDAFTFKLIAIDIQYIGG